MGRGLKSVFLILGLALPFAFGCGEKSKEQAFEVKLVPENPLVNTVKGKRFVGIVDSVPQFEDLNDNWIQFRVNFKNGTPETVTINALKVKVKYIDSKGQEKTAEAVYTPGDFASTSPYWLELSPGQEAPLGLLGATNAIFYLTGMPKEEGEQENFNYELSVEPLGWFGTFDDPKDRFNKSEIFVTR